MTKKDVITQVDEHRVSVPLFMLDGNLEVLLENHIECEHIGFKWYEDAGIVLTIRMNEAQKAAAALLGFRMTPAKEIR